MALVPLVALPSQPDSQSSDDASAVRVSGRRCMGISNAQSGETPSVAQALRTPGLDGAAPEFVNVVFRSFKPDVAAERG